MRPHKIMDRLLAWSRGSWEMRVPEIEILGGLARATAQGAYGRGHPAQEVEEIPIQEF